MKKIYLGFAFLLTSFLLEAQTYFQSGFGDTITDKAKSVVATSTRKYCIAGTSGENIVDSADIAVYIVDSLGGLITSSKIGAVGDEFVGGMVETTDGGFIIVGTTYASSLDPTHSDIFAIKVSSLGGILLWSKVYGGADDDEGFSVMKTADDNYLILGSTKSFGTATKSALALKINDNGDQQWCNVVSSTSENFFNSGTSDVNGNYVLGGGCYNGNNFDNYLVKMSQLGSIVWSKRYLSGGTNWFNAVNQTSEGGFIAAGISVVNTAGDTDQSVIKFDFSGTITWAYNYGTSEYDNASSIFEYSAGKYIVCGYSLISTTSSNSNQMLIEAIDGTGNILWSNTLGDTSIFSEGSQAVMGNDGGFAAVGNSVGFSDPNGDVFIAKSDTSFSTGCFEFPILLSRNVVSFNDSVGASEQLVTLNVADDTLNINPYYDQYSQNCFFDNVSDLKNANNIKLFPNPAENILHVQSGFEKSNVIIFDNLGRIIISKTASSSDVTIDITSLNPGIYILEINSENNFARSKFIKE